MPSEQEYIETITDLNTLLAVRDQRIKELELQIIKANKLMQGEDNALPHNQKENGKRDGNEEEKKRNEKKEEKVNG
tara:strand:+ start:3488 stop:3715 length:228 start_codon:yes stop_codon:yes gene_type:complete